MLLWRAFRTGDLHIGSCWFVFAMVFAVADGINTAVGVFLL